MVSVNTKSPDVALRAFSEARPSRFVTISVDDGHPTDLRMADLLDRYRLKATFYVPAHNPERPVLSATDLRALSRRFELGGHTMTHVSLCSVSPQTARHEVVACKQWLEDLTGDRVIAFCYPRGKYDHTRAQIVKEAGFLGARTCKLNLHAFPPDPFDWGVTTHAFRHSHTIQMRHALLEQNFAGAWNYWHTYRGERDWPRHFLCALDRVARTEGIAHLYLHSWEIEQLGAWSLLESIFREIDRRPALTRVTNGDLYALWHTRNLDRTA